MLHVHTNEYTYTCWNNQALFWTDIREPPDSKLRSQRRPTASVIQNFAELPDVFVCDFGILNVQTSSKVKNFPNLLFTSKK